MTINTTSPFRSARFLPPLVFLGLILGIFDYLLPRPTRAAVQSPGATTVRVNVDLVTLEVVVLDKKGDPVRGLKKENFRIFEDGKGQEISTLEEVSEAAGKPDLPIDEDGSMKRGKEVLILFDDTHISVGQYKLTRDSAEKYAKDHMRPQDLFAVASYNVSLTILQNFTHDVDKVVAAILKPSGSAQTSESVTNSRSSAAARDSQRMGRAAPEAPNATISAFQSVTYRAAPLLQTLDSLHSSLGQLKGRKAILLYSEDFTASTNIHSEYLKVVNSARNANVVYYTIDARGLDSLDGAGTGQTLGPQSRASASNARARSNTGVDWAQFDKQPMENMLRPLAKETGGTAIYNTSDFNQQLDEADHELSNYYVLGFVSNNPQQDGKYRRLEIRSDVKGVTLKHQPGYVDIRPVDVLARSKEERVLIAAMTATNTAAQLDVVFRAAYFYDSPALARIPISAKIRAASIGLRKKGGQLGGDLNIMGIAYSEDGSVSARFSETQHILLDKEAESNFRKQNLVYRNYFRLRPGKYVLKLAVSDDEAKVGKVEQSLTIPGMPEQGMTAGSLILADQLSRLPDLVQNLQGTLLEENDPLTFNGVQVGISIENQFQVNSPVPIFFKLYNLGAAAGKLRFTAKARLLGDKGEVQALGPISLDQNVFTTGKTEAVIGMTVVFDKAPPGKYKLEIEASETTSNQTLMMQTDLQLR